MASPTGSASSPPNLAPAPQTPGLAITSPSSNSSMAALAPNGVVPATALGPRKEWIIPPRPKPGRKPATDTPPTKRKAQNRAAQRAFRERRAARVGELEEQLKETEEEREKRENTMREELADVRAEKTRLEADVRRFIDEAIEWRGRYDTMEQKFNFERKEKELIVAELAYLRHGARSTGTNAVPLPPRQSKTQIRPLRPAAHSVSEAIEPLGCGGCTTTGSCACVEQAMTIAASGCGRCTAGSHCECLEETLKSTTLDTPVDSDLKRPISPSQPSLDPKKPRLSVEIGPQEIDFTAQFSSKASSSRQKFVQETSQTPASRIPVESCGFCTEGTYCVCAEAAAAAERETENRLPPLLSEVTPPPSDTDVTTGDITTFKLPSLHPNHRVHHAIPSSDDLSTPSLRTLDKHTSVPPSGCVNGPGTCQQCQNDPRSGLFCRSLAAMRALGENSSGNARPDGCCGGSASGGGCCKNQTDLPKPALSCADTYKTLASHRNFDQASDDISNWLPKLHTLAPRYPGRGPLDIEVASVLNVIKYFDVRFGRE